MSVRGGGGAEGWWRTSVVLAALVGLAVLGAWWPWGGRVEQWAKKLHLKDGPMEENAVYFAETQYQILTVTEEPGNARHRAFYQDKLRHSEIDLGRPEDLKYPYMAFMNGMVNKWAGAGREREPVSLLMLGGGGYAYPNYLMRKRPGSRITVVELDPGVTKAAVEAFGFPADAPVEIHHMDARNFVKDALARGERWDIVLCDVVSDYSVPYQLTTREFMEEVKGIVAEGGMYVMNTIDAFEPGEFLNGVYQTMREVWPHVGAVTAAGDKESRDTTVFSGCAAETDWSDLAQWTDGGEAAFKGHVMGEAEFRELEGRNGKCVLTDDWAPVENLLAAVVKKDKMGKLSGFLQAGIRAAERGDTARAESEFRKALELAPGNADALSDLGHARELAGDEEGALEVYAEMVQRYPEMVLPRNRAAMLLARRGHLEAAVEQWGESLRLNPEQADVLNNLGAAAVRAGETELARKYWRRALELAPEAELVRRNLEFLEGAAGPMGHGESGGGRNDETAK